MIGFSSFKNFILLKAHFSDYKFVFNRHYTYKRITTDSFLKRKDKKMFQLFEEKHYDPNERIEIFTSAFLFNKDTWIGNIILEHNSDVFHQERIKIINSLESKFRQDCQTIEWWLIDNNKNFSDLVLTKGINPCILLELYKDIEISLESLLILDEYCGFLEEWFPLNPLLIERRLQYIKYRKLLFQLDKDYDLIRKHYNSLLAH